jgi:hypothetical protein
MSRLEIGSPDFDLMNPLFYARDGVCILVMSTGNFWSNLAKFEGFERQEFREMRLLQFH